jgi:hypothetical protein
MLAPPLSTTGSHPYDVIALATGFQVSYRRLLRATRPSTESSERSLLWPQLISMKLLRNLARIIRWETNDVLSHQNLCRPYLKRVNRKASLRLSIFWRVPLLFCFCPLYWLGGNQYQAKRYRGHRCPPHVIASAEEGRRDRQGATVAGPVSAVVITASRGTGALFPFHGIKRFPPSNALFVRRV